MSGPSSSRGDITLSANPPISVGRTTLLFLALLLVIGQPPLWAGSAYLYASFTGLLVVDTMTTAVRGLIPTNFNAIAVAAHPDGTRLYVAYPEPGHISVIDTASYGVVQTIPLLRPRNLAVHPRGAVLYVNCQRPGASYFTEMTAVVDTRSNTRV